MKFVNVLWFGGLILKFMNDICDILGNNGCSIFLILIIIVEECLFLIDRVYKKFRFILIKLELD